MAFRATKGGMRRAELRACGEDKVKGREAERRGDEVARSRGESVGGSRVNALGDDGLNGGENAGERCSWGRL